MQPIIDAVTSSPNLLGIVGIFLCVITYLVLLVLVRWNLIARAVRASLRSQIKEIQVLLTDEQPHAPPDEQPATIGPKDLRDDAEKLVKGPSLFGYFF
jgi:hypothetical protein